MAASCRVHPQDVAGALARVEADVVAADAPVEALAGRAGRSTANAGGRPSSYGHVDEALLGVVRVEVDDA